MMSGIRERPERVPLSFAQRRLWFLAQLEGPGVYNVPLVLRLAGELDRGALAGALGDVVGRHESLRTVFPAVAGEPFQRVLPAGDAVVSVVWRDAGAAEVPGLIARACGYGFGLADEIPVRAEVLSVGPREHVLVLVMHHIACDGWSMSPLARDLAAAYGARLAGVAPGWGELPVQYADYTLWQYAMLGPEDDPGSVMARQSAFWRRALQGVPEDLALPADRPRPAVSSHRGGVAEFGVDAGVHAALLAVARQAGVSPFMVVQAALAVLLTRLGAGTDIPLGVPVAGRGDRSLNDLVGFFVNTLVLRTDTSGDPSFRELLGRVRAADLPAFQNQDLPFERLVETLNPARSPARHPLFQVMLAFQNAPETVFEMPGLSVEMEGLADYEGTAKFDLSFSVRARTAGADTPAGLEGTVEFAADLFDRASADLLALRFARVLQAVAADPGIRLSQVELLDTPERDQILHHWNHTTTKTPAMSALRLFEEQVAATPEAVAVSCADQGLTYRELNERASQLAAELMARDVRLEDRVAVLLPRSADSVAALLAVFKAGGVYLPLDITASASRIESVCTDAAPALAITTTSSAVPGCRVSQLALDTCDTIEHPAGNVTDHRSLLQRAAYVLYEAGSTGTPEGVIVEHASLGNLWNVYGPIYADHLSRTRQERARVVSTAPLSFDGCWGALLAMFAGHELHLLDEQTRDDPAALVEYVRRHEIGVIDTAPGYAAALVEYGLLEKDPVTGPSPVRTLVIGGDPASGGWRERIRETRAVTAIKLYGPTGNAFACVAGPLSSADPPVLGRPVANVQVFVLDEDLRLVPAGVTGELYVAGALLARGYLRRPGLTARQFMPCPFGEPGARMYRTGDLVRWRRDGNLEFLGRAGNQVLVDRRGLPAPDLSPVAGRAPRDTREKTLCGLFADVLGTAIVSIDDDFFQLGGHSLLAVRLLERIRDKLGQRPSLPLFFRNPTVAGVILALEPGSSGEGQDENAVVVLRPDGSQPPLFCIHPVMGTKHCFAPLAECLTDRPVFGLPVRDIDPAESRPDDLGTLVSDYITRIRKLQPTDPYQLLGWSLGGNIAHAIACALQDQGDEVALLALMDSYPSPGQSPDEVVREADAHLLPYAGAGALADELEFIEALAHTSAQLARMVRAEPLRRFKGHALYFTATLNRPQHAPAAASWEPYISGDIENHDIRVGHFNMAQREPLTEIANILSPMLVRPV